MLKLNFKFFKPQILIMRKDIIYKLFVAFSSIFLTVFGVVHAQDKVKATAVVNEVTVFTYGAEISNKVNVNLPKGSMQLYIQNVARDINVNSVQIAGPDGITVLSVSQGARNTVDILSPAHRLIQDSLDLATARKEILVNKQKAAQGALKILNNDQLLGGGGKVDLTDLSKLVDYYQLKSLELNTTIENLTKSISGENKTIARLEQQIRTFTGTGGVLIVQMSNARAFQGTLNISYMASSANWQAYYDLRAKSINDPLDIFYKAKISQSTGVDWKNVKLTLSTGNPSQNGNAPILNPSYAQLNDVRLGNVLASKASGIKIRGISSVNIEAKEAVLDEVVVRGPATTITENQLSATFDIETLYDIMSNGEPHSVTLKEYKHPASFKYYAVPKLDKDAFLLAEVNDFEKLNLVAGEANVIFENMFVGTSYINPNVATDSLNLSMGRDKAITLKRERIMDAKSNQTSGSSKRQIYTYELRIRNGKSAPIEVVLKDQYPISTDKSIEIELTDNGGASVNKETGILTWAINVKPGETKTYRFTFTVKSPKDKVLTFN